MRGGWRLLLIPAAAVVAVALFFVFRGADDEDMASPPPPPPPAPLEILIPINTEAITRRAIPRGRHVVLTVSGAEGEEIHLHGYDIKRRIGADNIARLSFRATIPGRFEVEVEGTHRQVADLTVR